MPRKELQEKLKQVIRNYLTDKEGQHLAQLVNEDNVRFVLLEFERRRIKPVAKKDEESLAEISLKFI